MENKESYQEILKRKKEHYGNTEAAYEFAAEEYASQQKPEIEWLSEDEMIEAIESWCGSLDEPDKSTELWAAKWVQDQLKKRIESLNK